jgi:hypothetical protein
MGKWWSKSESNIIIREGWEKNVIRCIVEKEENKIEIREKKEFENKTIENYCIDDEKL